jgi:hypothetical protein
MTGQQMLKPRGLDPKREAELQAQAAAYAEPLSAEDQAAVAQLRAKLARRRGRVAKGGPRVRGQDDSALLQQLGIDRLVEALREAIATMRRMPSGRIGPAQLKAAWPATLRDAWSLHELEAAQEKQQRAAVVRPTAQEITRMDVVLHWLVLLASDHERIIVVCRAKGMGYRAIARDVLKGRCNKDTVRADYLAALVRLFKLLGESGINR